MLESKLKEIEKIIGYEFNNISLLRQAFTRRSFTNEYGGEDNEVLEFIGDKALDLVVIKILIDKFSLIKDVTNEFYCDKSEGELSKIKKGMVSGGMLAEFIDRLGISENLLCGQVEDKTTNFKYTQRMKEDLFEAIIGAVAVDSNWNFDKICKTVIKMTNIKKEINKKIDIEDYVILVQQWYQKTFGELPKYVEIQEHILEESYYDENNNIFFQNLSQPLFTGKFYSEFSDEDKAKLNSEKIHRMMLTIPLPGLEYKIYNLGETKNEVRQQIAFAVYEFLKTNKLLYNIKDEIGKPNIETAINQLQELYQKGYIEQPQYEFHCLESGKNLDPFDDDLLVLSEDIWNCRCKIEGMKNISEALASSKKNAKKKAAYYMLREIYENML